MLLLKHKSDQQIPYKRGPLHTCILCIPGKLLKHLQASEQSEFCPHLYPSLTTLPSLCSIHIASLLFLKCFKHAYMSFCCSPNWNALPFIVRSHSLTHIIQVRKGFLELSFTPPPNILFLSLALSDFSSQHLTLIDNHIVDLLFFFFCFGLLYDISPPLEYKLHREGQFLAYSPLYLLCLQCQTYNNFMIHIFSELMGECNLLTTLKKDAHSFCTSANERNSSLSELYYAFANQYSLNLYFVLGLQIRYK